MAYNAITDAEIASGKPVCGPTGFGAKVKGNIEYLYSLLGTSIAAGVPNGSFEIDSDSDGVPDSWSQDLYAGGSGGIYTTSPADGAQAIYFTHPGGANNGGGYETSDYIECSEYLNYVIGVILWSTAAGMKNKVQVQFYTKAKGANGSAVDLYNSTSNPTTPTVFRFGIKPTADSRYFKLILVGGYTDTDVAGTTYFDDVVLLSIMPDVTAGDMLIGSAPTERSGKDTSKVKKKEIRVLRSGTYRTSFEIKTSGETASGRIYKNGVAFGTNRTTTSTSYGVFEEDLVFAANDLVQLYCSVTSGYTYYCQHFSVGIAADGENTTYVTD
ncbi:MAG: hypothetical protein PHS64_00260 [Candidatus Omnitrophica bacterium]|nr:hypothetical protein [Candidatus Omnitrophota bacterium]